MYDLLIRGGAVVNPAEVTLADVAIADGVIAEVAPELAGPANIEIDARGLYLFPGMIDAHVHFNDPGRDAWEGFATGSRALAAGGGTLCIDMPLNASPPTIDALSFQRKVAAASRTCLTDFALWGGLVPGNLEQMEELAACGVIGFKAFMSNSGIADFAAADDLTLYEGMRRAARLGLPVALHAENDQITSGLAARARAAGYTTARAYLNSRPAIAEVEAVARAILFAETTGCALHLVHLSVGRAVALVTEAASRGLDITCETCPHYLVLTDEDMERIGAAAKCAPPLRSATEREVLWDHLIAGEIAFVASDHSPAPLSMKQSSDFFAIWGGIAGCQTTLHLMLAEGYHARGLALNHLAQLLASNVAQRFRLPRKGFIAPGYDADLAIVHIEATWDLTAHDLYYRHPISPFIGREMQGTVQTTLRRGHIIARNGRPVEALPGRLITPQ